MNITAQEAEQLVKEIREACPTLQQLAMDQIVHLVSVAFKETNAMIAGIEGRIREAGCMPGDVMVSLLCYGAAIAIHEQLPRENERRELLDGGRLIGKFIAEKYGEKIRGMLVAKNQN